MEQLLESKNEDLKRICQATNVQRLYAFGSVMSGDFREDSDIDFLISFPKSLTVEEYTESYFALHYKLSQLFHRNIDLVTERTLSNPYFIESINETKKLLYEA